MSVYSSGVDAYRDTTKWLSAFLPVGSLITAGIVVGPALVTSAERASSVGEWWDENEVLTICGVLLFGGIAAILWAASRVLSVEPKDLGQLWLLSDKDDPQAQDSRKRVASAVGSGATAPYFYDLGVFEEAMANLAYGFDNVSESKADGIIDTELKRLEPATELLREWSVFNQSQGPFRTFRWVFVASSIAITLALCVAPTQLASGGKVDKPTEVEVSVSRSGAADLREKTACSSPEDTTFTAIGGTWTEPELSVDGPGCGFGETWWPEADVIELRIPAAAS